MSGSSANNKHNSSDAISDHEAAASLIRSLKRNDDGDGQSAAAAPSNKRSRMTSAPTRPPRSGGDQQETSYYGPAAKNTGDSNKSAADGGAATTAEKQKANFGLSGALAKDSGGGGGTNIYKGVALKFQEPPEARTPNTLWRFYVFKGEEQIDTLHVSRQSAYLFGRLEEIADVHLEHPSCSTQHAVLQYRATPNAEGKISCQPYLLDLESTNGSFINGVQIDAARYYQLKKGDVLRFGSSKREYVLLTAETKSKK
jgi:smad nuclear-interacting protein 1